MCCLIVIQTWKIYIFSSNIIRTLDSTLICSQFTFTLAIWTMLATFAEQGDSSGQGVLEARYFPK